jgi:hypothetical protein
MVELLLLPAVSYCFGQQVRRRLMGSLVDELQRREAAARAEAEELRRQIAQLSGCLAGVEEQLSRLVTAREVVDEVLGGTGSQVPASPSPVRAEVTAPAGPGHRSAVTGVLAVPPWRAGLEVSVLPQGYRDVLEVAEDAGRPLRAAQIAAAAGLSTGQGEGGGPPVEAEAAGGAGLAGRGGRAGIVRAARTERQRVRGNGKTGVMAGSSS